MVGHGSPRASQGQFALTALGMVARAGWGVALLASLALAPRGLLAAEMRVRLAWGGGDERLWSGTISLSGEGTLAQPRPLGIEADEPGSMWLERGRLMIRQRSPRTYDGVDLLVSTPVDSAFGDSKLLVQLSAAHPPVAGTASLSSAPRADRPIQFEIPLAGLSDEFYERQLDAQGNRLLVRRTPGDVLRVSLARDVLVFSPGEVFGFTLQPHLLPLPQNSKVKIKTRLVSARDQQELWWAEHDAWAGQPVAIPMDVGLPQQEGVYELIITATPRPNLQQAIRKPLRWNKPEVERKVQLLVLSPKGPAASAESAGELRQVGRDIDPGNPGWQERLARLPQPLKLPRLLKGPWTGGSMKVWRHPVLGELAQLDPSRESPDVSWEAYTLPVSQPGQPHVLEIDYPSDVPQTLGISVLEPNAAGALMPIGLDSGIDSGKEAPGNHAGACWLRHRLIFWPRTSTPLVLLSNRSEDRPAVYGKIRVFAGWEHLPRAAATTSLSLAPPAEGPQPEKPRQAGRLLAAYFDRPLFPENFSAAESLDSWSGRSLDDWETFYAGGTRLVEYLEHVGFGGLMISVLADGSTIYPSRLLQPTPRYDTGAFFATGQDPVRKDVLEMLFRMFDREGLQLIPALEFAAPLPELEEIRRAGGPGSRDLQWIGPDGATWSEKNRTRRGLGPYYNLLEPRVQEAMLNVVRELIQRYAHHESFAGLAIQLSADGYAQLPGPDWGMDDATIARFQQFAKLKVPGGGPNRFAERADFLCSDKHRRLWLQWRAREVSRLYRNMHAQLTAVRPGSRLYLAGAGALSGAGVEGDLRPALPRSTTTLADALLQVGIDGQLYQGDPGLILLRPERLSPSGRLKAQAVDLEISQMPDADDYFRSLSIPGSLFFHRPQQVRIQSFDQVSPFQPSYTWLVTQPAPSDWQNRRRFVHSLATLDSQVIFDGGWLLPLGQEDSIRHLVAAYGRLPAIRFQRADELRAGASQPVTFRYATHAGRTYVYVVNDSPLNAAAWVRLSAPADCRLEELTGRRQVAPLEHDARGTYWRVDLQPYDLVAVRLPLPGVELSQPQVSLPPAVKPALQQRIRELGIRASLLRSPPPLKVLGNPGFERPPVGSDPLPGWATTQQPGVTIAPDKTQPHQGNQSVKMTTNGPWACLVSQPFEPPATGRLSMSVWLRVGKTDAQPALQLALEGNLGGQRYYRYAPVGAAAAGGSSPVPIGTDWTQYEFQVHDLPLEGLSQLRVRLDLKGPGEVWVDDVELFNLVFDPNERKELNKLITKANVTLEEDRMGDCLRVLQGYWPRFLEEYVQLPPGGVPAGPATRAAIQLAKPPEQSPPTTGFLDRVKSLLPIRF
jgi:hypothetical protein